MEGTLWGGPMTGVGHSALPRARHMDPKASSTRDQPASGMSRGAERRFAGGGNFGEVGAGGTILK